MFMCFWRKAKKENMMRFNLSKFSNGQNIMQKKGNFGIESGEMQFRIIHVVTLNSHTRIRHRSYSMLP